jgi:hypothetical protein
MMSLVRTQYHHLEILPEVVKEQEADETLRHHLWLLTLLAMQHRISVSCGVLL